MKRPEIKLNIILLPPGENPGSDITSDMDCWKAVYEGPLVQTPALRGFGETPADALQELVRHLCDRLSYPDKYQNEW
jgi:hypothetical protein